MSVIVKSMEMPPSCYFCGLTDTSFIRCEAFSPTKLLEDDCEERRPKWCPLIELPPHGRLIDADKLLTDRMKSKYYHFYIPENEVIPTDLRLYVDGIYVTYERFNSGFRFFIYLDDEEKAMEVAKEIVWQMELDHDEPSHGISWRTISLEIVPQEKRYSFGTIIDWKYRVRDSY